MGKIYQVLLGLLIALLAFSYFFPWGMIYGEREMAAISWAREGAAVSDDVIFGVGDIASCGYLLAYFGMMLYKNWARVLLILITVIGGFAIPAFGISVQSGYEAALGYFASVGDGAIIAISFSSEFRLKFFRK